MNIQPAAISPRPPVRRAFTLVELLVVLAIIALVIGMTVPAVNSVLRGRAVAKSINDVAGIIEYARAEAMGRRAYVWVTFANVTNSDGNSDLCVAAAISTNGMNYWGSFLRPISKLVRVANVNSVNFTGLPTPLQTYMKANAADLQSDNAYVGDVVSYKGFNKGQSPHFVVSGLDFNDPVIEPNATYLGFSPEGELTPGGDPYNLMCKTFLSVGLAPVRGTAVQKNARDGAVVTIYGGSAKLRITRL